MTVQLQPSMPPPNPAAADTQTLVDAGLMPEQPVPSPDPPPDPASDNPPDDDPS